MDLLNTRRFSTVLLAAATGAFVMSNAAASEKEPIMLTEQGSFFVGGHTIKGEGTYDPTTTPGQTNQGSTFWQDQMYVQYQIPANPRKYPLILVHGGGGTGRVWETTPDGREGYQTYFLRQGFPVYIVDAPRRGRSGYPSFNGPFGELDGKAIIPNKTGRAGVEYAWSRWRIGPEYPDVFPVQQFDVDSIDEFAKHLVPDVRDPDVVIKALTELVDKLGPSILVTHSESGAYGWKVAAQSENVRGIVSYEPGFVFPEGAVPDPIPMLEGTAPAGTAVPVADFEKLSRIPIQVVYGDNIPNEPIADIPADGRRVQVVASELFVEAINERGGKASILHLPDAGLRGNSHFMFSDLNSDDVAHQLSTFLEANDLDKRQ